MNVKDLKWYQSPFVFVVGAILSLQRAQDMVWRRTSFDYFTLCGVFFIVACLRDELLIVDGEEFVHFCDEHAET